MTRLIPWWKKEKIDRQHEISELERLAQEFSIRLLRLEREKGIYKQIPGERGNH
jgi:hypothetical protein